MTSYRGVFRYLSHCVKFYAAIFAAAFLLTGCAVEVDVPGGSAPGLDPSALAQNGVQANGLVYNGLAVNGVDGNGLTSNALTASQISLAAGGSIPVASGTFFEYLIGCALTPNQSVTVTVGGNPVTYKGSLGLAPEWGEDHGSCDQDCKEWVSACMLARTSYLHAHRWISLRGPTIGTTKAELFAFPREEGAYWGNVFTDPPELLACHASRGNLIERVCGPDLDACVADVLGACEDVCAGKDPLDGYWYGCPKAAKSITVYRAGILRPSSAKGSDPTGDASATGG